MKRSQHGAPSGSPGLVQLPVRVAASPTPFTDAIVRARAEQGLVARGASP